MKILKVLLFLFLTVSIGCSESTTQQTETVNRVFSIENLATQTFEINTETDTIIKGKSGTQITIGKNCFVDKNGKSIAGKISFELKEALTLPDMVLGNLTTTSNGKLLQTGGMIYTNATANGENLFLAKDKALKVSVPTQHKNDSMLIFKGEVNPETQSINWVNPENIIEKSKTETKMKELAKVYPASAINNELLEVIEKPQKPIELNDNSERILSIIFETSDMFPELQQYQNVKFRVSEKSNYNPEDAEKTWYDVKLEKTNEEGTYKVIFKGVDKGKMIEQTYLVSPAFEGNDYKKALALYEKKFEQYENKKKEIAKEKAKEIIRLKKEQEKQAILAQENWEKQQKNAPKNLNAAAANIFVEDGTFFYIFQSKQLGWANIDRLFYDKRTTTIELLVSIDEKIKNEQVTISMLFKNQKLFLPGYEKKDGTYGFSHYDAEPTNLPIGEEAIIVATIYRNNIPYFAFQKIIIAKNQNINLSLTETSKDKLETFLKENI